MNFDRETRSVLQRTVTRLRDLLQEDVADQLRRFGIQDDGQLLDLGAIAGLTDEERSTGIALRDLFHHLLASEQGPERSRLKATHARMTREIGFSTLNRLMAIRMAEERGLITQAVGKGFESAGFRMYELVANDALGNRYATYRAFLDALYDEIAIDLPALFDRGDIRTRVFPSEQALGQVFDAINAPAIAPLWREDETIGWVYQYYNDPDERREMRKYGAPRNSREMAVRNQFFTPRYVVEFLTDNTLGRTWYETRRGETALATQCRYLVRRPDEVFLSDAEQWPKDHPDTRFILGETDELAPFVAFNAEWRGGERQENGAISMPWADYGDAGQRLIYFAHINRSFNWSDDARRPEWENQLQHLAEGKPDAPVEGRTQDLWDLLFAVARAERFSEGQIDLHTIALTRVANEIRRRLLVSRDSSASQEDRLRAPELIPFREKKDPRSLRIMDPACGSGHFLLYAFDLLLTIYEEAWNDPDLGPNLQREYRNEQAYQRQVPVLILHNNLYGIDIDPRATQIAALALWLRAQREWHAMGVGPADRPQIRKSNIVCAEPMPGERTMLEEYLRTIDERLRPLVRTIWEKMALAGEAGSLLKIEEDIREVLATARRKAMIDLPAMQMTMYGEAKPRQQVIEFATKDDIAFWSDAEEKLLAALRTYATSTANEHRAQRKLFADDAAQGFAFIDVSRTVFDTVLMNPPFGEASAASKSYIDKAFPRTRNDVFAAFTERWLYQLHSGGHLGAITSRTGFFLTSFQKWREEILLREARLAVLADLGFGVLDAMVETAAYCLRRGDPQAETTGART